MAKNIDFVLRHISVGTEMQQLSSTSEECFDEIPGQIQKSSRTVSNLPEDLMQNTLSRMSLRVTDCSAYTYTLRAYDRTSPTICKYNYVIPDDPASPRRGFFITRGPYHTF